LRSTGFRPQAAARLLFAAALGLVCAAPFVTDELPHHSRLG
jgi:hypothetical protein